MAISKIEYGKALRPSTVELMAKIDEVIDAVNAGGGSVPPEITEAITNLQAAVTTLQNDLGTAQGNITNMGNSINELETVQASHTTDLTKINNSLYTPLQPDDTIDETTPGA